MVVRDLVYTYISNTQKDDATLWLSDLRWLIYMYGPAGVYIAGYYRLIYASSVFTYKEAELFYYYYTRNFVHICYKIDPRRQTIVFIQDSHNATCDHLERGDQSVSLPSMCLVKSQQELE
ncbi:hypothetical protein ACJX0J_032924, partial [Zea mays]